jgi:hypothetical protein
MPILSSRHDYLHPIENDPAWSESYYFNGYDAPTDSGLFTRIGLRPNERTIDVGLSVWMPDGDLAEYRSIEQPHQTVDTDFAVGDVRYEMLEPNRSWRVSMTSSVPVRSCRAGSTSHREADLQLNLTFEATSPAIGTDGQTRDARASASASDAAGTTGKGHFEQAGVWHGWIDVDGQRYEWRDARGNRDRSWGPRQWGGPSMWRWFSINVGALDFGGICLGTSSGDLHRGWVWDGQVATSIAEWNVRTDVADDHLTQRVVHLDVVDKKGRHYQLHGDVLRVADIGRSSGTMINEGLTRWTYVTTDGTEYIGSGIAEYLHQLDGDAKPLVAVI